jgi:hypothetical protein
MHGFDTKAGEGPVPGDPETAQSFRKSIRAASLCREITDGLHGLFYPSNYAQYGSFQSTDRQTIMEHYGDGGTGFGSLFGQCNRRAVSILSSMSI